MAGQSLAKTLLGPSASTRSGPAGRRFSVIRPVREPSTVPRSIFETRATKLEEGTKLRDRADRACEEARELTEYAKLLLIETKLRIAKLEKY
jgi:hypothetical protein